MGASQRSLDNLKGVHPNLVKVTLRAMDLCEAAGLDFTVTQGLRTLEQEKEEVAKGKSATLHSMHLIQPDGYGHAVDIVAIINGVAIWTEATYVKINGLFQRASQEDNVPITWGGEWSYPHDCDHWQLKSVHQPMGETTHGK